MYAASAYHKALCVMSVFVAFVLVMQSGIFMPQTKTWTLHVGQYLASVIGISAGVAPNEINTLTAQITARERELDARERLIDARVADDEYVGVTLKEYLMSAILLLLLILITTNYVLDYIRARRNEVLTYAPLP